MSTFVLVEAGAGCVIAVGDAEVARWMEGHAGKNDLKSYRRNDSCKLAANSRSLRHRQ
jgi:hypothetical protein